MHVLGDMHAGLWSKAPHMSAVAQLQHRSAKVPDGVNHPNHLYPDHYSFQLLCIALTAA